jgi:ABC-type Mn2+/Zn2+ transport system permease subunit
MATIKKSKVTVSFLGIIGILLIATLLLVPATQARAETVKFRVVN